MVLAYKEYEAPLKAYLDYIRSFGFPIDESKLKLRPVKTTKLSLADLKYVPNGVKYIAIAQYNFNNEFFDVGINIRTENSRFISHHFEISRNPEALANLVIEEFKEGKLTPQVKENTIKYLDRFVENGIYETNSVIADGFEFIYFV